MALQNSILNINLDTNRPNQAINESFLQGNTDKIFKFKLLKNSEEVTIKDDVKPVAYLVYYKNGSILKRFKIAPTLEDGSINEDYNITLVDNTVIIPFEKNIALVDHAGRTDLILNIVDGTGFYTYSCTYNVSINEAYTPLALIDNLPSIDKMRSQMTNINSDVDNVKKDMNVITGDMSQKATISSVESLASELSNSKKTIVALNQDVEKKANADLSNVGDFSSVPDGALLYKKDGVLTHSSLVIDENKKMINSPYSIKVPANTLYLGNNIEIHENGGFIESHPLSENKKYILLQHENDSVYGSSKPVYYERGKLQQKIDIQPDSAVQMNNVITINYGNPLDNHQTQALYLNFANTANNFRLKLTINGKDVAYYPSESAWEGIEQGLNLISGIQRIPFKPYMTSFKQDSIIITLRCDNTINLMGNGSKPYMAIDKNMIIKKDMALMEDLNNIQENANTIKDKLQSLVGDERLNVSSINGVPEFDRKRFTRSVYPTDTSVLIPTDCQNVFYFPQFTSNEWVITQQLPSINEVEEGYTIYICPKSKKLNNAITLAPFKGDTMNNINSIYTVNGKAILIASNNNWNIIDLQTENNATASKKIVTDDFLETTEDEKTILITLNKQMLDKRIHDIIEMKSI